MRKLFFAALGALVVAGVAPAQQPVPVVAPPGAPAVQPYAGPAVIRGNGGCTNCGPGASLGYRFYMATGGDCQPGRACQNGCGSLKSDLAFHFGSCKGFFNPCGPVCGYDGLGGHGHLFGRGGCCPTLPFNAPYGTGWCCPRQYDSYANH
jgi:hypothetical protein